jgi:hypothetical protein
LPASAMLPESRLAFFYLVQKVGRVGPIYTIMLFLVSQHKRGLRNKKSGMPKGLPDLLFGPDLLPFGVIISFFAFQNLLSIFYDGKTKKFQKIT